MHDESLERRLRATLHDEAASQPFTITAAELERRVALRGRGSGNRRLTLLLAAAVAIGGLGVASVVGGLFDDENQTPSPSPIAQVTDPAATASPAGPVTLADLDALIAANLSGEVVFAQSNGPAEGPEPPPGVVSWALSPPFVRLDLPEPDGIYMVTLACLGGTAELTVEPAAFDPDISVPCDGQPRNEAVDVEGARTLQLSFSEPPNPSWRIVVRHAPSTGPTTPPDPAELQAPAGHEELISVIDRTAEAVAATAAPPGPPELTEHLGTLSARLSYVAQVSCVESGPFRFALGDDTTGVIAPLTLTQVPCDGLVHVVQLGIAQPHGSQVFAGAVPTARWSLLLTSTVPPVSLAGDLPEWTVVAGLGPDLEFDTVIHAHSGLAVDGGGPVMVVLECAGQGSVEVKVQTGGGLDELGTFEATCTGEGARTSETFDVATYEGVRVEYQASFLQWIAMSILVPDDATE